MEKVRFNTKAVSKIRTANIIIFVLFSAVVLGVFLFIALRLYRMFEADNITGVEGSFVLIALMLTAAFQMLLWFVIPIAGALLGIQSGRLKGHKERATFTASHGIIYYREILKDVSPADLSIVMDLRIEQEKDISATLLRLYHKNAIDFSGRQVIILDEHAGADDSERELLSMLSKGPLSWMGMFEWKQNRLTEAEQKGYVQQPRTKSKGCGCFLSVLLLIICVIAFVYIFGIYIDGFGNLDSALDGLYDAADYGTPFLKSDMSVIRNFLIFVIVLFGLVDFIMLIPAFAFFKHIAHSTVRQKTGLERTPKGDELAEKAAGLKRFITEFSVLSEREKEEVRLWDDFLVYAVVLEENDRIIEDIFRSVSDVNLFRACNVRVG